ncbi:MAG: hypothetical protein AAGA29_00220 [Planctomycetota bacterium]
MLPRRSLSFSLAGLLAVAALQPGCVVRDRVVIVPWDWSDRPAEDDTNPDPQRPGGRVGTNAVLSDTPRPVPTEDEAGAPGIEPKPDAIAETTGDTDAPQEPDAAASDDAAAQTAPDTDQATQDEADSPAVPEPETAAATTLDPPLHPAWAEDSDYNRRYIAGSDPATASGEIEAVGTFVPAEGASPGLLLTLNSGGTTVDIHVAPLRYLRALELRFDFGESLTVTGRWANIDGKRVLLAQSITRGESEIVVRDPQTGRPAWVDPLPNEGDVEAAPLPADDSTHDAPTA